MEPKAGNGVFFLVLAQFEAVVTLPMLRPIL